MQSSNQWKKIGLRHHHGINLPLAALRTEIGSGIGEFLDLIPFIEWCSFLGLDVIQLLPLNDSGNDASPYCAESAMALHPIYLSLHSLPFLEKVPNAEQELEALRHCNTSKRFSYPKVLQNKLAFLKTYFNYAFTQIKNLPEYKKFVVEENEWLLPYAFFKVLKQQHDSKAWWDWDLAYQTPYKDVLKVLVKPLRNELNFYCMLQFLAYSQMQHVRKVADQNKLFLKGDIPILINKDSADVWEHRELFDLEFAAGAPADMYAGEGQYWGFPVYNWPEGEKSHYHWWKERLRFAEKLYHIYRLDHIVGFFHLWAIPPGKKPKDGHYIPEREQEWVPHGKKIVEMMLKSSSMLPIGEDLGNVPPEVRDCLRSLGVPGTKVMRWERRYNQDRSYIPVTEYIPESMVCVSTHDSEPISLWWEKQYEEVSSFCAYKKWEYYLPLPDEYRLAILQDCHRAKSLFHINLLQEYLAFFPELAWENPEDDRINIPGTVSDFNWTYRFKPTLKEITSHQGLKSLLSSLAQLSI